MSVKQFNELRLRPWALLRMFEAFRDNPHRVFIKTDFGSRGTIWIGGSGSSKVYLDTLLKLGIIEKVDAYYSKGLSNKHKFRTDGYKFKKNGEHYELFPVLEREKIWIPTERIDESKVQHLVSESKKKGLDEIKRLWDETE